MVMNEKNRKTSHIAFYIAYNLLAITKHNVYLFHVLLPIMYRIHYPPCNWYDEQAHPTSEQCLPTSISLTDISFIKFGHG